MRTQRGHLIPPHGRNLWVCVSRSSRRHGHAEGVRKTDLHLPRHVARWPMDQAFTVPAANEGPSWQALPLDGGPSVPISAYRWHWSASEDSVAISGAPLPAGRSYIVPLRSGQFLPLELQEGVRSEQEVAELPGARRIDADMVVPGPSPDIYAFYRTTTQRNLYRIPIR